MSKDCPFPIRSKKNGTKPFKKQRKINRSSESVESTDSRSNSDIPPSQELLKSKWAPSKSPAKVDHSATPNKSDGQETPFVSPNPFTTLIESKDDEEEQDQEDEEMRDSDYIPEGETEESSTEEDDDSEEDVNTDELDMLMRDQEGDLDDATGNMTCNTQTPGTSPTYVSSPTPQGLQTEQSTTSGSSISI
jgi:hypothetical protein